MHDRLTHRSPIDSIRISAPKGFHAQLRLIKGAILALPWLKSIRGTSGWEGQLCREISIILHANGLRAFNAAGRGNVWTKKREHG